MNKTYISALTVLALVTMAGCASKEKRELVSGSYDYLEASEYKGFVVPEDLDQPNFSNQYQLPDIGEDASIDLIGDKVSVKSPSLVVPLVSGSHVKEGSRSSTVSFDQTKDDEPLTKTIWDTVLGYLEKQGVGVESFDKETNILITDWIKESNEDDISWYQFTKTRLETARKIKLSVVLAPHGRSADLTSELVAYIDTDRKQNLKSMNPLALRREEVAVLNDIIEDYDVGLRIEYNERIAQIRKGFPTELGTNSDGQPALIVAAEYTNAWPRLLLVLRKLGFNVKDLDQSNGLLFVKYTGLENSWWGDFFGSDKNDIALDKKEYRLQVERAGENTAITFMDEESVPFELDKITEIYKPFADVMSTENLDI